MGAVALSASLMRVRDMAVLLARNEAVAPARRKPGNAAEVFASPPRRHAVEVLKRTDENFKSKDLADRQPKAFLSEQLIAVVKEREMLGLSAGAPRTWTEPARG